MISVWWVDPGGDVHLIGCPDKDPAAIPYKDHNETGVVAMRIHLAHAHYLRACGTCFDD